MEFVRGSSMTWKGEPRDPCDVSGSVRVVAMSGRVRGRH